MFIDHMYFSWVTGMVWTLAMLTSFAMVRAVGRHGKSYSNPAAAATAFPGKKHTLLFSIPCHCRARSLNRSGTRSTGDARFMQNRDLLPCRCRAPAKGKEDTSC